MVHGLVAGPSSEEALGLLPVSFWERLDRLSPGLPARRRFGDGWRCGTVTPGRPERTGLMVHDASGVDGPDWRTRGERQMEGTAEQVVGIDNRLEIQQDGTMAVVTPGLADGSRGALDKGEERIPADT
ncbi:hypothetical protein NDU88_009352 [Pleurodeles waltl]|uniref:Uncharacterized protein n=1 Tax=Pleurodeles waltl TaxID=8319 RepID=A0AAV7QSS0_PLEWA|nr:hypothetical protein NDU88_009352 [Pleurodeles waltl]